MAIQLTYPEGCALVAGGAGNVGQGVVRRLAEAGLPVTFTYSQNADRANSIVENLRREGLKVWACQMELRDGKSIDEAIRFAQGQGGKLHTVACTSGAHVPFNDISDFTIEEVEQFFDADGMGYYRLVNRTVPVLRANGGGSITLCTTIALLRAITFDGISPFSKGAVQALMKQVAWEEGKNNIRCNAVPISWILPRSLEEIETQIAKFPPLERDRTLKMLHHIAALFRGREPIHPNSAGDLFAFLASDQANCITGQSVSVEAGATL